MLPLNPAEVSPSLGEFQLGQMSSAYAALLEGPLVGKLYQNLEKY